jgi:hypothetical protein
MSDSDCQRPDYVQNALEATCDALITLESIRASPARDRKADLQVVQAMSSLRQAISELRLAHAEEDESMVGLGFVVRTNARRRAATPVPQASPRRTA